MAYDTELSDSCFSASFLITDYASFIAWRDWGWPDTDVYNCFGSAVIRSCDDALIYGRMQGNTLNAGLTYPPGGSLEQSDLTADGNIDMTGAIARELAEETGLEAAQASDAGLMVIFDEQRISIAHELVFDETADRLVDKIRCHIAAEAEPELSDAVALRSRADLTMPMPGYARHLATHSLPD